MSAFDIASAMFPRERGIAVERLLDDLKRLQKITRGCREDMHEPDEQGLSAKWPPISWVFNLDNACSGAPFKENGKLIRSDMGFWLIREYHDGTSAREWFNLADIINLARNARIDP